MYKALLLFALFFIQSQCAHGQQSFSLQSAMDYAVQNGIQSKRNAIDIADAQQRIKETTSIGIPKLNASLGYNYNYKIPRIVIPDFMDPSQTQELSFGLPQNAQVDVTLQTLLLDGQYIFGLKAARLYKSLVNSQSISAGDGIKYQVAKAYLGAWVLEENLVVIENNINNLESSLTETRAIQENGFAEQLDVDRLDLSLKTLNTELENLRRLNQVARNNLKFLMNYPIQSKIELTEDLNQMVDGIRAMRLDFAEAPDISNRSEYDVFSNSEMINEVNVKRLKAGYFPNITAIANYQANLSRNRLFDEAEPGFLGAGFVGASLNVPIFDGFERKAQIERARLNLELVKVGKEEFEQAARMESQNALIQLNNALETLQSVEENQGLAERIYNITQIKYREGVGSSIERSQAERELYAIQAQVIDAKFNVLNAKIDLDKATGKLK